jgi:hypothetical protein
MVGMHFKDEKFIPSVLLTIFIILFFGCSKSDQSKRNNEVDTSQKEISSKVAEIERKSADRNALKGIGDDSFNIKVPVSIFIDEKNRLINDTLVCLDYLREMMSAVTKINASKLDIKFPTEYDHIILYNDTISIEIEKKEFDAEEKVLTYEEGTGGHSFLTKINGKPYWGTDYSFMPDFEIKTFRIIINNNEIEVDEDMYNDLFNPNLLCQQFSREMICSVNAYVLPSGEILLIMKNGEAAASYYPLWIIKDKKIIKRAVADGT